MKLGETVNINCLPRGVFGKSGSFLYAFGTF